MRSFMRKLISRARRSLGVEDLKREVSLLRADVERLLRLWEQGPSPGIRQELQEIRGLLSRSVHGPEGAASKISQRVLVNQYRELVRCGGPFPALEDVEFRAFSQNGEDGILLYIFSLIGMGSRAASRFVRAMAWNVIRPT